MFPRQPGRPRTGARSQRCDWKGWVGGGGELGGREPVKTASGAAGWAPCRRIQNGFPAALLTRASSVSLLVPNVRVRVGLVTQHCHSPGLTQQSRSSGMLLRRSLEAAPTQLVLGQHLHLDVGRSALGLGLGWRGRAWASPGKLKGADL